MNNIFIVATPIGNLDDFSFRALKTLRNVDLILAEDTRVTKKLLDRYGISKKIISFNEHNEQSKLTYLKTNLNQFKNIALLSDAGTPLISDPGKSLVQFAFDNNLKVTPIPGPSALTTLISVAPFEVREFTFLGFLEKRATLKNDQIQKALESNTTFIFFESPNRIIETLEILAKFDSKRMLLVGRELTKLFEEIIYLNSKEALEHFKNHPPKGEFVIAVSKSDQNESKDEEIYLEDIKLLKDIGISSKDITTFISKKYNLKKNSIYNKILKT